MTYHPDGAELRLWADGDLTEPAAWSVEAHLEGCGRCRSRVPADGLPEPLADLPVQGRIRAPTVGRRIRLLIGAGPQARAAWFSAVAVTVLLTVLAARPGAMVPHRLLLMVAPVLPVLGTAASYGPRTDPLDELVGSTAYGGLRIVLWRTSSVLAASLPVAAAGGLVTGLGTPVVWLLPACALTVMTLAVAAVTGPAAAAAVIGAGWVLLVGGTGGAQLVTGGTTPAWLMVIAAAALAVMVRRPGREAHR